jgi:hypothetical protein
LILPAIRPGGKSHGRCHSVNPADQPHAGNQQ